MLFYRFVRSSLPVALLVLLSACRFDSSTRALGEGAEDERARADAGDFEIGTGDVDGGGTIGPGGADAGEPDGGESAQLHDDDLLVRYYADDQALEEEPTALRDVAGAPTLDLGIIDPQEISEFVTEGEHMGLRFTEIDSDARVAARVQGSKIRQPLDGSRKGTIELVLEIEDALNGSRISHIGRDNRRGYFSLRASGNDELAFSFNEDEVARWDVDLPAAGRMVVHLVVDTSQQVGNDRVKLYIDGQLQPRGLGITFNPLRDSTIDIPDRGDVYYVLGNREVGDRGLQGTFYYAAMYSGALSADEVADNSALLIADDDLLSPPEELD